MSSTPFLNKSSLNCETDCMLCRIAIRKNSKAALTNFGKDVWPRLGAFAERWSHIPLDFDHSRFNFTQVFDCIKGKDSPFGKAHKKCRLKFFKFKLN